MINLEFLNNKNFLILFVILSFVGIFLFILSIVFYIQEIREKKTFTYKIKAFNEENYKKAIADLNNNKNTKKIKDELDLLLARSQFKYLYCWTIPKILILMFCIFFYSYFSVYELLEGIIPSIVLSLIFSTIPILVMEYMATKKSKSIKKQILSLSPILINNIKLSDGNIPRGIEKTANKIKYPLKNYFQEFTNDIKNGIPPFECFKRLKSKVNDDRFSRIVECLEIHFYKGGNSAITLDHLNKEFLRREIKDDERKKENSGNALGIYISIIGNLILLYVTKLVFPEILIELKKHQLILVLIILNLLVSFVIAFLATRSIKK